LEKLYCFLLYARRKYYFTLYEGDAIFTRKNSRFIPYQTLLERDKPLFFWCGFSFSTSARDLLILHDALFCQAPRARWDAGRRKENACVHGQGTPPEGAVTRSVPRSSFARYSHRTARRLMARQAWERLIG